MRSTRHGCSFATAGQWCVIILGLGAAALGQEAAGGVGAATRSAEEGDSTPGAEKTEAPAGKESVPTVYLRDNSKVSGWPDFAILEVETAYGKLQVPREQLVRVRFARRVPPQIQARIEQLLADLASEDFDKREAATEALRAEGPPALDKLRDAMKSPNEEVRTRAESLVTELGAKAKSAAVRDESEDGLQQLRGPDDEVVTTRMTIRGNIPIEALTVKTQYGDLQVSVADIGGMAFRTLAPTAVRVEVTAQSQPPANWVDTKLDVEKGQTLKIQATGQITVRNYGIVSGPAGNTDWSGHATFGNFPMLSLVGKVGKSGKPFLVGQGFSGKASGQGRLYLGVVSFSPYPGGAAGGYQAKIQTLGGD